VVARTHNAGERDGQGDKAGDHFMGEQRHTPFRAQVPRLR
jgi:hypothetical protein